MPFFWKPKEGSKKRTKHSPEHMRAAVLSVVNEQSSIRATAKLYNIDRKTLERYVTKYRLSENKNEISFKPNYKTGQVFSDQLELMLADYLKLAAKLHYGLSQKTIRTFAYEFGHANNIKMPDNWELKNKASYDWVRGFMHRNPRLSLRTPRSTSLSRATAFNRSTVGDFFNNLKLLMTKHKFEAHSIYNIDETGVTTVHQPGRIIAEKNSKEVSKVTSAERGTLVTVCCAISAIGNTVPPFFVYPRVRVKDTMTKGAPPGSVAAANPSGWMIGDNFELYLDHFIKYVKCSQDSPVLAVLDNHDSHITPAGIQKCKSNGVFLLTIPPHTSHKLQPLDRGVFGPFKTYFNQAADNFMVNHPGKPISIYDIPELVAVAFFKAMTPQNIIKGFQKCGIYPFNSEIFTDEEFLSSYVTDRPNPTSQTQPTECIPNEDMPNTMNDVQPIISVPSTSTDLNPGLPIVSPEMVRPFPKAGARKNTRKGRKPGKTLILTSTPVKEEIDKEYARKLAKRETTGRKKATKPEKRRKTEAKRTLRKKLKFHDDSTDQSDDMNTDYSDPDNDLEDFTDLEILAEFNLSVGDFVLVKFCTKQTTAHFAGSISYINSFSQECEVVFLRRKDSGHFSYPDIEDRSAVLKQDIVAKLPLPLSSGGTERVALKMTFDFDFSKFENVG